MRDKHKWNAFMIHLLLNGSTLLQPPPTQNSMLWHDGPQLLNWATFLQFCVCFMLPPRPAPRRNLKLKKSFKKDCKNKFIDCLKLIYGRTKLTIRRWFVAQTLLLDLCQKFNTLHNEMHNKVLWSCWMWPLSVYLANINVRSESLTLLMITFLLCSFPLLFLHFKFDFLWFLLTCLVNHGASSLLWVAPWSDAVRERKWKVQVHSGESSSKFFFLLS